MAVEDRVGDQLRRDAVADPVEGLDPLGLEPLLVGAQLVVERVVGDALRDEHDGVGLELDRLAELVGARHARRARPARGRRRGACERPPRGAAR